ncbi:hypothetical protein ACFV8Z_48765 [Streptomyces sp. NPDC059837]|uniref:hypothetical protein n=1 Tax=Streptomyces sp. NPDC059837 TaxID=3346968 RepID=UPI0036625E79
MFGSSGAIICTWLIDVTGSAVSPAFYLSGVALITLVAGLLLPRNLASGDLRR